MTDTPPPAPPVPFTPAELRPRADGWTPERQQAFVAALAQSGCVTEAAAAVGLSVQAAYALRRHPKARAFRRAWDDAIALAVERLSDAVIGRAIHGVAVPHFFRGEQVGEHRRFDNRLAMFVLRYRDPARYGQAIDREHHVHRPERRTLALDESSATLARVLRAQWEREDREARRAAARALPPDMV